VETYLADTRTTTGAPAYSTMAAAGYARS